MSKYIWTWGVDGTVLYIYEVLPPTRFRKYHKLRFIHKYYTSEFANVKSTAQGFISRLEAAS